MTSDLNTRIRAVKAVIFDLDDTLVESTVDFGKFKRLVIDRIASYGEDKSKYSQNETIVAIIERFERLQRAVGVPASEIRRRLAELDKIMDEVEMERVGETTAYEGASRLLEILRRNGVKIGVLTRGCLSYASSALARAGLTGLVDSVECRNSDTKAKPNPEAYLKLVESLGVQRDETIFVGDHPIDARCAANAGVPFIAVRTGDVSEETLKKAGSIEVFKDVGELADWIESVLAA